MNIISSSCLSFLSKIWSVLVLCFFSGLASAQPVEFLGGEFSDPDNWSSGEVPDEIVDTLFIPSPGAPESARTMIVPAFNAEVSSMMIVGESLSMERGSSLPDTSSGSLRTHFRTEEETPPWISIGVNFFDFPRSSFGGRLLPRVVLPSSNTSLVADGVRMRGAVYIGGGSEVQILSSPPLTFTGNGIGVGGITGSINMGIGGDGKLVLGPNTYSSGRPALSIIPGSDLEWEFGKSELIVQDNAHLIVPNSLHVGEKGKLVTDGFLILNDGEIEEPPPTFLLQIPYGLVWSEGTLELGGSIDGGVLAVGGSVSLGEEIGIGTVDISGGLTIEDRAELKLRVVGNLQGTEYDYIDAGSSPVSIDGKLVIEFLEGFQPEVGDQFAFFSGGQLTGGTDIELRGVSQQLSASILDSGNGIFSVVIEGPSVDVDTDRDGVSDERERQLGTSPNNPDTDFDAISDSQELEDGSDPTDPSSFLFRLSEESCFDWNGFLGMRFNIAEFTNFSDHTRSVRASLFDISGVEQSNQSFTILPGAQFDLLVHDMQGFAVDAIGTVCAEMLDSDAQAGDVDGRMLLYRPDNAGSFDFVLASPFSNPLSGRQFVQFNTFHPSLDPAEIGFFTANWLTIANAGASTETGELIVYGQDGTVLLTESITLPGDGRRDISVHDFGANRIGLLEWIPARDSATFRLTLNRYFYSDTTPFGDVQNAVSLQGVKGSRQVTLTPADTRGLTAVLEVSNTSEEAAQVSIDVFDRAGQLVMEMPVTLQSKVTQHIILDQNLVQNLGTARVSGGGARGEIVTTTMQYGRTPTAGVSSLYPIPAREALGTTSQGTYNTFLNQGCSVLISNVTSSTEEVTIDMTRFDGEAVLRGQSLMVPGNGVAEFDLCSQDLPNVFGVVKINSTTSGNFVNNVVRVGESENYRVATPVR